MRLLVIGHTAHYVRNGKIVGWGPTVNEVAWLAKAFEQVTHLACLHPGPGPDISLPYPAENVRFVGVPPAGGKSWRLRLGVFGLASTYIRTILREIRQADVIQVRLPGPLGFYGMILASLFTRKPRWMKYAGNWMESEQKSLAQSLQRGWLRRGLSRGPVTVNGRWPGQPKFIYPFLNPSFSMDEVRQAKQAVQGKSLSQPVRLVFAGQLKSEKGIDTALEVIRGLVGQIEAKLDVLGDGPGREIFEKKSQDLGLAGKVNFCGWVSQKQVKAALAEAHFVILPSLSEGWPKVLSEGMAYGAVPLSSRVSAIPQILEECGTGFALDPHDPTAYIQCIFELVKEPARWQALSQAGLAAASHFTYEHYLVALDDMLRGFYGASPLQPILVKSMREELAQ